MLGGAAQKENENPKQIVRDSELKEEELVADEPQGFISSLFGGLMGSGVNQPAPQIKPKVQQRQ